MTRIGILETGRLSEELKRRHGDYPQMFRAYFAGQAGMEFSVFDIAGGTPVPKPATCDGWIITGSPAAVYEEREWIRPAMVFVQEALEQSVPTLGICFGHQLMAQAMGGKVVKSEKGHGIGVHRYRLTDAGQKLIPDVTVVNLIAAHQDQVTQVPDGAVVIGYSEFCAYAALAYGPSGLSFQGHPEFTVAYERELIDNLQGKSLVEAKVVEAALETLDKIPLDAQRIMPVLKNFLTRCP